MSKEPLRPLKRREPIVDHLPLPCSEAMKIRYQRLQNELHSRGLETLHQLSREKLESLLDEVEERLGAGPGAA